MSDLALTKSASHSWVIAVNVRGDALSPAVMDGENLIVETDQVRQALDAVAFSDLVTLEATHG